VQKQPLSQKKIFIFWAPLAATWFMMAMEGPFVAAIIARMANPKFNLAAYGVAFSFAVFLEAPIIMIISASNALVKDRESYIKLRNFTFLLNGIITLIMFVLILPPVFFFIAQQLIGLPESVSQLTHLACVIMLPWPAAIGIRRFYQGILIRSNLTRRVAYGTIVRLLAMGTTGLICYFMLGLDGATVGALAHTVAVILEALASKLMVNQSVKNLLLKSQDKSQSKPLTYRYINSFYYPLALTSVLAFSIQPMVTFFLGKSRMAIESLAVLPVIHALAFIFRSLGFSYQEVGIALLGDNNENYKSLRKFAIVLGFCVTGGLAVVAFSPLAYLWFREVSGLSLELTHFAIFPTQILTVIPGLLVILAFQRAFLVNNRKTKPITIATVIEVLTVFTLLFVTVKFLNMIGAVGAVASIDLGRMMAIAYLFFPLFRIKRGKEKAGKELGIQTKFYDEV